MRLIDVDALKDPLELQRASYARIGATERAKAYADCLWEIAQAPTVGGWISVKDRLPEESGKVLVYCKDGYMSAVHYSAKHQQFNNFDACAKRDEVWDVTHWMPLPEPPKEEDV